MRSFNKLNIFRSEHRIYGEFKLMSDRSRFKRESELLNERANYSWLMSSHLDHLSDIKFIIQINDDLCAPVSGKIYTISTQPRNIDPWVSLDRRKYFRVPLDPNDYSSILDSDSILLDVCWDVRKQRTLMSVNLDTIRSQLSIYNMKYISLITYMAQHVSIQMAKK